MSALLTGRRGASRRSRQDPDCRARGEPRPGAGPTLDDVVSRTWEVLRAGVPAACLVCGHELTAAPAAGPGGQAETGAAGGRCESCGSTLG